MCVQRLCTSREISDLWAVCGDVNGELCADLSPLHPGCDTHPCILLLYCIPLFYSVDSSLCFHFHPFRSLRLLCLRLYCISIPSVVILCAPPRVFLVYLSFCALSFWQKHYSNGPLNTESNSIYSSPRSIPWSSALHQLSRNDH